MFETASEQTPQPNENALAQPQPSQPPHGTAPAAPSADALGGPEWARGKTREQLIRDMEETYAALPMLDLSRQPARLAEPQPMNGQRNPYDYGGYSPSPQPQNGAGTALPPDPELAQRDPDRWQREFDAYNRAVIQDTLRSAAGAYSQPLVQSQAETARELSRNDPRNRDVWSRYGHEVDREMAGVPMERRNKRTYDQACDMVRGRHFDELVALRSTQSPQKEAPANGTASASADATPPAPPEPDPFDAFWESSHPYAQRIRNSGQSKTAFKDKIRKTGMSPAKWAAAAERGNIVLTGDGTHKQQAKSEPASAGAQ